MRFQVLTAASMKFRFVFWDVLPCKIIVGRRFRGTCCPIIRAMMMALIMEAARTSETSVDNYFTRKYIPEDKSELHTRRRENLKSHKMYLYLEFITWVKKVGSEFST
jgi:hypothetical protein